MAAGLAAVVSLSAGIAWGVGTWLAGRHSLRRVGLTYTVAVAPAIALFGLPVMLNRTAGEPAFLMLGGVGPVGFAALASLVLSTLWLALTRTLAPPEQGRGFAGHSARAARR